MLIMHPDGTNTIQMTPEIQRWLKARHAKVEDIIVKRPKLIASAINLAFNGEEIPAIIATKRSK